MGNRLQGKVAIVTGATRGIGMAVATTFVGEGAKVLFTGRDKARGKTLEAELGKDTRFLAVNVAEESEIAAMVAAAVGQFGGLDCLISNAGSGFPAGAVTDLVADKFWQTFHVYVGSIAYGMKHAAPEIAKRGGGSIVNVSSIAASGAGYGGYAYSGAKAAMLQLSKWAAMNLAPAKVRVNTISPGPVLTAIFGRGAGIDADVAMEDTRMAKLAGVFEQITPLHLAGKPEDIAHAAVYLASDESCYVTGQDLVVDGGLLNSRPAEEINGMWERIRAASG
jgi:NAD(P)-dependent dehydrogenase (short-subunit alcohol dehydrogenase family)